jgi:hypothetical protein
MQCSTRFPRAEFTMSEMKFDFRETLRRLKKRLGREEEEEEEVDLTVVVPVVPDVVVPAPKRSSPVAAFSGRNLRRRN